jgi:ribokinase
MVASLALILSCLSILISLVDSSQILVVGSVNADTFLAVKRLPVEGENLTLTPGKKPIVDVPGGKGCTQAVAASKLLKDGRVSFVGQFGNDPASEILQTCLNEANVDLSQCGVHDNLPSGRGYVFLTESGQVSAVVSGGSNQEGWETWKDPEQIDSLLDTLLEDCDCLLLQREVPEYVNHLIASRAKARGGITVIQDIGGEDRPMDEEMMACCDWIMPNESELARLVRTFQEDSLQDDNNEAVIQRIKILQQHGARNVLVTRGIRGCTAMTESGEMLHQPAFPTSTVVDETGAGDCFRAAFAVALMEACSLQTAMEYASAAGACSVERNGAVPSTPSREEVEARCHHIDSPKESVLKIPRGDGLRGGGDDFPFLIGSRLNSMKDRPELWDGPLADPRDWVRRQGTVRGLTCVDFNYPQHFHSWSTEEAKEALVAQGRVAGAVCLRYPTKFARGAMNHPDPALRREAINLTKEAAQVALDLGCREVVVWSAYDGFDYPFQVDYDAKWQELVDAFRECCDAFPDIRFSVEYKVSPSKVVTVSRQSPLLTDELAAN